jgi:hypothetical protein
MKKLILITAITALFCGIAASEAKVKFNYSDKYGNQEKIIRPKIIPGKIKHDEDDDVQNNLDTQCVAICGEGYFYDRPGAKNNGKELVCTKYPLDCGYKCTIGWDIRYLVGGTNFTCQEAQQTSK